MVQSCPNRKHSSFLAVFWSFDSRREHKMKIRIKPRELEISEKDSFKNDLLDRKTSVEMLSNIIASVEGSCVLAVNPCTPAWKIRKGYCQ